MAEIVYTQENSKYKTANPSWHVEDSPWKATQILKIIDRNLLKPKSIVEIGCGAGEILRQLNQRMDDKTIRFEGYEISPDAYCLCKDRAGERLRFFQQDLLETDKTFDILLMIDVFEHVEDYFGFLRKAKEKATYKIYHIPLDLSHFYMMMNGPMKQRKKVGHIHYFNKETALASLQDTGHEIVDWFYTKHCNTKNLSQAARVVDFFRQSTFSVNPDLAVNLFGGCSLIVLAK
jgi:SAM-dependent methyltransferase